MTEIALLEPSLADAAAAIKAATDLSVQTTTQWLCSLRQIAKMIGRPMENIPARLTSARFAIERLHHARVGANAKTLANYKSNAKAALKWFAGVREVASRGTPLTSEWERLRDRLPDRRARSLLSSPIRYCSARRIAPSMVDEAIIDGYMTEKNLALVRQVVSGNVWPEVINLPRVMMAQARSLREHAPVKAAVLAQIAVAIAILTFAPVRLNNLVHIRLDENLIKPGGLDCPYMLVFRRYDVKNRQDLEHPFDAGLTALIDEYINEFRSTLLRGSNELWLFPGEAGGCKDARTLSGQITNRIQKAIGLSVTVHQFRHAAAAIYLQHHPGDYETVRRILAHHNIQTTIRCYCGLETLHANKAFGDIVRQHMNFAEPV
jgi:integrase